VSLAEVTDNALLATVVTALLIREGGRVVFSEIEWRQAIDHDSTLYLHREKEGDDIAVVLMTQKGTA
jgi:hypothetical protein